MTTKNKVGRPKADHPERIIKLRLTPAEYAKIIENTTPRERAEILLKAIMYAK